MKTFFKSIIILIITLTFLYAFSNSLASHRLENLAYVIGLGIDKSPENNKVQVSFQFMQLFSLSEPTGEKPEIFVNSVTSTSINTAINEMNTYIGKELNMAHCNVIVFSEELAKEGISTEIYSLVNNESLRPSTNVIISTSSANSYLENVKPNLEKLITKYYDTFSLTTNFTGYSDDVSIGTFYNNLISDRIQACAMLGETIKTSTSSSESSSSSSSSKEESSSSEKEETGSSEKRNLH